MTKEKKQEINTEENKKQEVKLPQLHYIILGSCYIHTEKGMCTWLSPTNITLEENIKYLQFTIDKFKTQIEFNKKKEKEAKEEVKPVAENKETEYKLVK